ncbi:fungal-specific transcription factor domain-containing protein [Xylariales sp. PMI_506]|nr:fungal-specific transcription factor domain-containing protein [Xylariales sp. PMI_506]
MASPSESELGARPKACDLCFAKKIKCDMRKPECSNCVLYHIECRVSIGRSRARPPRPRPASSVGNRKPRGLNESRPAECIQFRMHALEEKMQEVLECTKSAAQTSTTSSSASNEGFRSTCAAKKHSWNFDPAQPKLYYGPSDEDPFLPPLEDIIPIIDLYFDTSNRVLPLFSQKGFMALVTGWYGRSQKRDKVIWANILAVIALGLQSQATSEQILSPSQIKDRDWLDYCMRNAQSVIPELLVRDVDLLGIQTILALALVFENACDLRPARTLVASAVTISHRMQLHSTDATEYHNAEETQERSRVFWILYVLDKGLSMRTKTPPMLLDSDIDLDFPPRVFPDGTGIVYTTDGNHEMNIFHLRVELASIKGKIYYLLYSGRARKIQMSEQKTRVDNLQRMLDRWYEKVPAVFRIGDATSTVSATNLVHMTNLHHIYMLCHFWIHGLYSYKAEWLQRASSLSRAAINEFAVATQGPGFTLCTRISHAPQEIGWQRCVDISRDSLALFQSTNPTKSMIWQSSGPHLSALVILLANMLIFPGHTSASTDLVVVTESIQLFDRLVDVLQSSAYEPLNRVVNHLYNDAKTAIGGIQMDPASEALVFDCPRDMQEGLDMCVHDSEYLGLENSGNLVLGDSAGFNESIDPVEWII